MKENPSEFWQWFYEEHAIQDKLEEDLFRRESEHECKRSSGKAKEKGKPK